METEIFYRDINYLAVLVATVVYFAIGALWYNKNFFGKAWLAMQPQLDMSNKEGRSTNIAKLMISTFLLTLVCVFLSATLVSATGAKTVEDGINLGVRLAIGFMATTIAVTFMYEGRPAKLFWIDAGYHFVGIVLATVILAVWK